MSKKILIMEDEKNLQGILAEKLGQSGYEVAVADDGVAGMKAVAEGKPDLILLDMMMPQLDGFGVLEQMKANDLIRQCPVIVISNSGQPVEIDRALALGVSDYIIKVDFDPVEVVEKVKSFFERAEVPSNTPLTELSPVTAAAARPLSPEPAPAMEEIVPADSNQGDGGLEAEVAKLNAPQPDEAGNDKAKVLLVEDDDFLRGICERKLKKEGYDVTISADGLDAFNKIEEGDYDLVLLDVVLPNMDGFDILAKTKQNPAKSDLPIIMLTNMGQETEVKRGLELGAADYIVKAHFSIDEIIEKMEKIIQSDAA